MESPLVNSALSLVTRGQVRLSDIYGDRLSRARLRLLLEFTKKELVARAQAAYMAASGAGEEGLNQLKSSLSPWLGSVTEEENSIDLAAKWYMINKPELLERHGVKLHGRK